VKIVPGDSSRGINLTLRDHLDGFLLRLAYTRRTAMFSLVPRLVHTAVKEPDFRGLVEIVLYVGNRKTFLEVNRRSLVSHIKPVHFADVDNLMMLHPEGTVISTSIVAGAQVHVVKTRSRARRELKLSRLSVALPEKLTGAAVFLAGKKRNALAVEWKSHLAGWTGTGLSRRARLWAALGFLGAAVRLRFEDAVDLAWWRPTDAVLRSRAKSNLFVWLPTLGIMLAIVHREGLYGLITNAENLIETWGGLYVTVRVGRWYRKVKPPKPRRARE
jgi:hypothetical protein